MQFTVVFESDLDPDYSYGLGFIASPVWIQGTRFVVNLNPETPKYQPGSVRKLIHAEALTFADPRRVTVVLHPEGHGTFEDLQALTADLRSEGFAVTVAGSP